MQDYQTFGAESCMAGLSKKTALNPQPRNVGIWSLSNQKHGNTETFLGNQEVKVRLLNHL